MSTIKIDCTEDVWGGTSGLVHAMLKWSLDRYGPLSFLVNLKDHFDHGYNHLDLSKLSTAEFAEFIRIVEEFISEEAFKTMVLKGDQAVEVDQYAKARLDDLLDRMRTALSRRGKPAPPPP